MMKLYRFDYSPYVRKVQMVLDLMGVPYQSVDVPYGDRTELAELTGGYIQVPVLVDDSGRAVFDSRNICRELVAGQAGSWLVPTGLEGPVWAYADWCDSALEDVIFRIASPSVRTLFSRSADRAQYVFVKERKFGTGCVDQWERDRDTLVAKATDMLQPTLQTLSTRPFLFGERPTLADAALYGEFAMLRAADAGLPVRISPAFVEWMGRLEKSAKKNGGAPL
jgi:glutathione S-transferase